MNTMDMLSLAANVVQVGSLAASVAVYVHLRVRERKEEQPITVRLVLTDSREGLRPELPLRMRMRELSRAELLGRLGMLPMKKPGARFALRGLASVSFLDAIDAARRTGVIEIPATREELEQFDL